jgi:hypothetical protein
VKGKGTSPFKLTKGFPLNVVACTSFTQSQQSVKILNWLNMAITKRALRKQAAKARIAAKKAAEQQSNAPLPEQDPGTAPHNASFALKEINEGTSPKGATPLTALIDGVTAPSEGGSSSATPEAIGVAISEERQTSPIVPGTSIVADILVPDPILAPIEPTEALALSQDAAPAVPAAKPSAPAAVTKRSLPGISPHRLTPPSEPAGPSYTRRDPVTGALAEDLDEDLPDHGHSTFVSDEMFALQLQLEEIRQQTDQKGKFRSDRVPDLQLAFATFHAEVNRHIEFLNDVRFANSVANAVHVDAVIIAELGQEEIRAEEDHMMAVELDGGQTTDVPPLNTPAAGITIAPMKTAAKPIFAPSEHTTGITIRAFEDEGPPLMVSLAIGQMAALRRKRNAPFEDEEDDSDAMSSKTYTERQHDAIHKLPRRGYQCTVCEDMFRSHEIIQLDCKHLYCPACLKGSFIHASSDVAYFPPRCCREIPVSLVSNDMSTQEMEDFTDTAIEILTEKRTYCSNNQCGKFIPPANIDADSANCTRCGIITCIHCRGKHHLGECPQDEALRSTLALAESEGWRRCHACQAVVELHVGCYHMTYGIISLLYLMVSLINFVQMQMWRSILLPLWRQMEDLHLSNVFRKSTYFSYIRVHQTDHK